MNTKKYNLINLISFFIIFISVLFSNVKAVNYNFKIKHPEQTLHNKSAFSLDLNLTSEYSKYQRLHPFICRVKFDKNLFEFQKVSISKNIRRSDILKEISDDEITIKFTPKEARIVSFSGNTSEIIKLNFICKCADLNNSSYFETNIINTETNENIFTDSTKVSIENKKANNHNEKNNTKNNKNSGDVKNADCRIRSLISSEGSLSPSFDPNIFKYEITVPKETGEIYFDVTPMIEDAEIKINKCKLYAPGTTTYINITCKNKSKSLSYLIKVKRNIASANNDGSESKAHNHKLKNKKDTKEKSEKKSSKQKRKSGRKYKSRSKNSSNEIYEDGEAYGDEDLLENSEDSENEEQDIDEKGEIVNGSGNNKTYLIFSFIILILSILVFLLFKLKSRSKLGENVQDNKHKNQNDASSMT